MVLAYEPGRSLGGGTDGAPFGLSLAMSEVSGPPRNSMSLEQSIVARAAGIAGTAHAYLCLPDRESAQLRVQAASGVFAGLAGHEFSARRSLAGRARGLGRCEVVTDYVSWPGRRRELVALGVRTLVEVPLEAAVAVGGSFGVARLEGEGAFSEAQVELILQFAECVGLTLENAYLEGLVQSELRERQRTEEELREMIAWLAALRR